MTEEEWLAGANASAMLSLFWEARTTYRRKLRLFACAACRLLGEGPYDSRGLRALEAAELFADGLVPKREMAAARAATRAGGRPNGEGFPRVVGDHLAWEAAHTAAVRPKPKERAAGLLIEIFCNPFRPVSLDRSGLTGQALSLARAAYEERALPSGLLEPARLAVLSDALEEAGCIQPDVLSHLRSPKPHVRGCWALDLVLGKE